MTVKFRDPISAKACIIVSHTSYHFSTAVTSHLLTPTSENAREVFRRS